GPIAIRPPREPFFPPFVAPRVQDPKTLIVITNDREGMAPHRLAIGRDASIDRMIPSGVDLRRSVDDPYFVQRGMVIADVRLKPKIRAETRFPRLLRHHICQRPI